ncbi:MAG: (5-formylfuran-3-yl)methyl phosphate synthase [Methylophilaceae bacterium]
MSAFLASVRCVEEAKIALDYADIIDLKEPHNGALGALPLAVIEDIVRFVDGRKLVSATVGDLPMQQEVIVRATEATAATGVDVIKVGLFKFDAACIAALAPLTKRGIQLVAVLFVDISLHFESIPLLAKAGFYGVMLDTAYKQGGGLCDSVSLKQLEVFLTQAREHGLMAGLAGSLCVENIEPLSALSPDYLGFRGALCEQNQRKNYLESSKLEQMQKLLQKYHTTVPLLTA